MTVPVDHYITTMKIPVACNICIHRHLAVIESGTSFLPDILSYDIVFPRYVLYLVFIQVKLVPKRCIINQWDIICPLDILANGLYIILPWTRDLQTFDPNRIRDIVPSGHLILQYSVSWPS